MSRDSYCAPPAPPIAVGHPLVLALWHDLGTNAWGRGIQSSTPFWDAPGKRLSGGRWGGTGVPWQWQGGLGSRGAVCCCLFPCLLWHVPSLEHFLPPVPFFQRRFSSAAVSRPSSCFVAPAILTTRLTIYPDGAGLLSCAWHVFSIYKFCAEAERTKPNKLCESSRVLGVLALAGVQPPQVTTPAPAPALASFCVEFGGFCPPHPCSFPVTPSDLALLALGQLQ